MNRVLALVALTITVTGGACGSPEPASRLISFRALAMRATRVVQSDTCDVGLVAAADARPGTPPKLGKTKCDVPGSYAHPGDEVQIELLWHDPRPEPKRSWMWTTCINPASTSTFGCFLKLAQDISKVPPDKRVEFYINTVRQRPAALAKTFEGNELAADPASDPRTIFRIRVPPDALKEFEGGPPGARLGASIGIVFSACPGTLRVAAEPLAGGALNPGVECLDDAGEPLGSDQFTIGVKRLFLREKDENADPRISSVLWDGQPWPETEVKTLEAVCDADDPDFSKCDNPKHTVVPQLQQPFADRGNDEFGNPFDEQVIVQYYATEGAFEFDVKRAADPVTRFAGRRGKLGPQTLWIVTRDNRAGVSWVKRSFEVK